METSSSEADALHRDLAKLLEGGHASHALADRVAYARDLWPRHHLGVRGGNAAPSPPRVVVWPESEEDVARVVRYVGPRGIPVVPFGAGSGVCGGVLPRSDAVVMDLKRMRAMRRVDRDHLVAEAEAGILGQHLEDALGREGLTLGHFPSSIGCSTLGGWVATRSAGQCSGRYGKIEDMVLALRCIDGRGELHEGRAQGETRSLLPLVIGSEGTLAIITSATLRVSPAPHERTFASFRFRRLDDGLEAIRHIYQSGLRPAVCRLYDPFDTLIAGRSKKKSAKRGGPGLGVRAITRLLRAPDRLNQLVEAFPDPALGGSLLVLVWEDDPEIGRAELAAAERIAKALRARSTGEGPARHWLANRHKVSYRQSPLYAANAFVDTMEVAATWARLPALYEGVRRALSPHVFVMAHFSHAYPDGASIYFTFAGPADDPVAATRTYDLLWHEALTAALDAGGSISHHHGIGRLKAPKLRAEHGAALSVLRAAKRAFDPHGVLNPGALLPVTDGH